MTINVYHIGDPVRVSGVFKDFSDNLADPTTVTLRVLDPSGNETSYSTDDSPNTVEKTSTGNYYVDVPVSERGDWRYRWEAAGNIQGAEPGQFVVAPSYF